MVQNLQAFLYMRYIHWKEVGRVCKNADVSIVDDAIIDIFIRMEPTIVMSVSHLVTFFLLYMG